MSMVIERARLYEVALPLTEPFVLSGGAMTDRRSLVIALHDAEGNVGYGESAPFELPFYSAETIASARALLTDLLLPRVLAQPVSDSAEMHDLLGDGIRGNEMARAGVETAWWDLLAQRTGSPLVELVTARLRLLGVEEALLERRGVVECGVALGIPRDEDPGTLVTWIEEALAAGYRRIKLKVRPGWDVAAARLALDTIRRAGRLIPLTVDANGAYHAERDAETLEALDDLGLLYIEQPCAPDALWDLAELAHGLATPLCLDESLTSVEIGRQVIAMGGPDIWNIKVQRVGGLEEACRLYALAAAHDIDLWAGTMPETGLGAQAGLALAAHAGFVYASDFEPSTRWYGPRSDLVELAMASDGTMAVPLDRVDPDLTAAHLVYDSASGT